MDEQKLGEKGVFFLVLGTRTLQKKDSGPQAPIKVRGGKKLRWGRKRKTNVTAQSEGVKRTRMGGE